MRIDRETWRVAAVFAAGFLTFFNLYTPQAILQVLARDLGASTMQIGLAVTVSLLAVSTIAPVAGAISDRFGRKRIVITASFTLVLLTLAVSRSQTLGELLMWRTAQGLMLPFIFTVTVAYIADECSGPQAIKTSGMYSSGTILGGFSGRLVGGVVADLDSWHSAFVVVALITFAAASFVAWTMPPEQKFRPTLGGLPGTMRAYGEHLRNPRLLATCFIGFGMLFSLVGSFTFVNFRLSEPPFSLSSTQVGTVFVVYLLAMFAAPIATRVAVRIGRIKAFLVGILWAVGGLGLTLAPSLPLVVAGLAFSTAGFLVVQALSLGFIGAIVPHARSSAVGVFVTTYYIGGAVGSVAPGPIWHQFGWLGVVVLFWVMLTAMAATALHFWRLPQPKPS